MRRNGNEHALVNGDLSLRRLNDLEETFKDFEDEDALKSRRVNDG